MNYSIKYCFAAILLLGLLFGCADKSAPASVGANGETFHGKKIEEAGALSVAQLMTNMKGKKEMSAKVKGEVEAVCKVKGCWMTLKRGDDKTMRVTFKDYDFFVPKDCNGKTAVVEGIAKIDTTSVETLRHFAEDEGLPQEEIDKITKPEIELVFVADGAIIM